MEPNLLLEELKNHKEDSIILRKLINLASLHAQTLDEESLKQWEPILTYIFKTFLSNPEVKSEKMLLASQAFFAVLSMESTFTLLKNTFTYFITFNSDEVQFLNNRYEIFESELFKLQCAHGYLRFKYDEMYSDDICLIIFRVIYRNCMQYTRYSYTAYKVLYIWLQRTMNTIFWSTCDVMIEQKLEAIIFSNWCNAINEISKQNSMSVFNMYLNIMASKYDGFLEFMFKHCVDNISWQNEIKYIILAEICDVWDNVSAMTSRNFLIPLSNGLSKFYLRSACTKVYVAIVKNLSENQWIDSFECIMKLLFHQWGTLENTNHDALQSLCKYWLEPTVKKNKNILSFLWELTSDQSGYYLRSHLQRMASELHIDIMKQTEVECYINDKEEVVRLNGFAICCHTINSTINSESADRFALIKNFLWYNANSTTIYMRDGMVKYFRVFYRNVLKVCETKPEFIEDIRDIMDWLQEFLLDCFEIGSCYQRKVSGLKLYTSILSFPTLKIDLNITGIWKFTSKQNLLALLRLILDSAFDIKQLATRIILDHFDKNILSDSEKQVLYQVTMKNCNSSKFYKVESAAAIITILASWVPLSNIQNSAETYDKQKCKNFNSFTTYSHFLLNETWNQLLEMKEDILKSVVQDKPFYGVLTALSNVVFRSGPESSSLTLKFVEKMLRLLKDAVDFFLGVLSSKSASTEYSSSFAEMGLAIEDAIKTSEIDYTNYDELNLTPAHQVLVSCIWMSLKVSCEIACEIGALMYSDETVECSANIIVTVLLRCRHKGAVESAGSSIGNLTRYLCDEKKYCELPKKYITNILKTDAMNSLNITRRGAGLSIMFHKIVVSDNRKGRPLLHFAVNMLLDLLDEPSQKLGETAESQHDSPLTRRLYFLRTLVADKEIHAKLIFYMERIALTCFRCLESDLWTVRNASLQLFGAIVPRLAGQSKGNAALDYGSGYTFNHFVTHYPVLADHVMKQLENFSAGFPNFSNALYLHSNIVHVLILLSKFSSSGCDLIDYSSREYLVKAKGLLRSLFKNPIWYVRLLAAKTYAGLTAFSRIKSEIERLKRDVHSSTNANLIHGYLLTMTYLRERLSVEIGYTNQWYDNANCTTHELKECAELLRLRQLTKIWGQLSEEKSIRQPYYVLETLVLQLSESISNQVTVTDFFPFDKNISILSSQRVQPGFFEFVDCSVKLYAKYIKRTSNVDGGIVERILNSHCIDQSVAFLNHLSHYLPILKVIIERLLSDCQTVEELLQNAMIDFVLKTLKHSSITDIDQLYIRRIVENLTVTIEEKTLHSKLWRLKLILIVLVSTNKLLIQKILLYALSISIHEEEYMRRISLELMRFSVLRFAELTDASKLTIIYCCLILLKDEISEVRDTIAECLRAHVLLKINMKCNVLQHEEIIYQKLLREIMFNQTHLLPSREKNIDFIKLFTRSIENLDINVTIENPFYHDDNPYYREESKFFNICFYYALQNNKYKLKECNSEINIVECNDESIDILHQIYAKYQLQREADFDHTNLEVVLNIKYVDYLLRKQGIVIQEYKQ